MISETCSDNRRHPKVKSGAIFLRFRHTCLAFAVLLGLRAGPLSAREATVDTFLVDITRSGPAVEHVLQANDIPVLLVLDDRYVVEVTVAGLSLMLAMDIPCHIIDDNPVSREYFCLHASEPLPDSLRKSLDLLYPLDHDRFIVRSETAAFDRLPLRSVSVVRLRRLPLPFLHRPETTISYLDRMATNDPLIDFLLSQVSSENLTAYIAALQNFGTRYSFTSQCSLAAEFLYDFFEDQGLDVDFFPFDYHGTDMRNVVATLRGTIYPDSMYIICGHYDSTNRQNPYLAAPGADDNASGTAAVLEAARILSRCTSRTTVRFICFAGEEQGLIGSHRYADQARAAGMKIGGVLNFDMIAFQEQPQERDILLYADEGSVPLAALFDSVAAIYTDLEAELKTGFFGASDHYTFQQNHYQAILVIERGTNPTYHSARDLLETLTIPFAAEVVRAGLGTLSLLAGVSADTSGPVLSQTEVSLHDGDLAGSEGNGNGIPEPEETIALSLGIYNGGDAAAWSVYGVLRTDDAWLVPVDTFCSFGDVAPGRIASAEKPFLFHISPDCPNGHYVTLMTTVGETGGFSRTTHLSFRVMEPELSFSALEIDDTAGDGDERAEGGESIDLTVSIENGGLRSTSALSARLETDAEGVILVDEAAVYPDIAVRETGSNTGDVFSVLLPRALTGTSIRFRLTVREEDGFFAGEIPFTLRLNQGWVLLVIDDGGINNSRFYSDVLKHLGVRCDTYTVGITGEGAPEDLSRYHEVIWFAGPVGVETLTGSDQEALAAYLENGGHLCLSGSLIGYDLSDSDFFRDYVHARYVHLNTGIHHLAGSPDNPVTGSMRISLVPEGINGQWNTGEIEPLPPACSILNYDPETEEGPGDIRSSGCGALAFENDRYRVAFFSFGIEGVEPPEDLAILLSRLLLWYNSPMPRTGDVNGDGGIDALDLVLAIHISLEMVHPTEYEFKRADSNYDGLINILDIVNILHSILSP